MNIHKLGKVCNIAQPCGSIKIKEMQKIDISSFRGKKTALVLSGGVVKAAAWHLGVALALDEIGFAFKHNQSEKEKAFQISTYVGSSAGSLISLYFASGFRPVDVIEATINKDNKDLKPISYTDMLSIKRPELKAIPGGQFQLLNGLPLFAKKLLKPLLQMSGLFTTQGLYNYINEHILRSKSLMTDYDQVKYFEQLKADLFIVATALDSSKKSIFSKYNYPTPGHDPTSIYETGVDIASAVAASMSVPPLYTPYPIKNPRTKKIEYYFDGEIRDTLSTHVAIDNNCEYIISSWTHTPYHFQEEIGSLKNYGMPAICVQALYLIIQKKIISARAQRNNAKDLIDTVNEYMRTQNFSDKQRLQIMSILERKLNYKSNVKLIDIFPSHSDYKTFFNNSFSLSPKNLSSVVSHAFKRTIDVFRKEESNF